MIGVGLTAFLVFLVLLGAPLFLVVGAASGLSFVLFTDLARWSDLKILVQHVENIATRPEFLAIPLFMATGAVMTAGGIAGRLVRLMSALLTPLPGGLAVAGVAACMFFASISGSSPVTLIAVGSMMVPALKNAHYPELPSLGLITTAGSLGCLVPPSLSMLIYSVAVSGSTAVGPSDLFLAGLLPAFLVAGLLALYSVWLGRKVPRSRVRDYGKQVRQAAADASWALLLPVLVLGGIYGGWCTPSQAGAVALFYSLAVTVGIYRELNFKQLLTAFQDSAVLMGALFPILVLSLGLNDVFALLQVSELFTNWVKNSGLSSFQFLLLVNAVLIVLGALMDSISATLVFAPLLAPVAQNLYGIDPLHFAVIFVVNMEVGYLMPPVATNLFVASAVFKKPFEQVVRAIWPTLGLTLVALFLVIQFPALSLAPRRWFPVVQNTSQWNLKALSQKILDEIEAEQKKQGVLDRSH